MIRPFSDPRAFPLRGAGPLGEPLGREGKEENDDGAGEAADSAFLLPEPIATENGTKTLRWPVGSQEGSVSCRSRDAPIIDVTSVTSHANGT